MSIINRPLKELYKTIVILKTKDFDFKLFNNYKNKISKVNPDHYIKEEKAPFDYTFDLNKYTNKEFGSKNFDKQIKLLCLNNKSNIDLLLLLRCKVSHEIKSKVLSLHYSIKKKFNVSFDLQEMFSIVLDDLGSRIELVSDKNPKSEDKKVSKNKDENKLDINTKNKRKKTRKKNIRKYFNYLYIEYELKKNKELLLEEEKRKEKLIAKEKKEIDKLKKKGLKPDIIKTSLPKKFFRLRPFSSQVIYSFDPERGSEIQRWTQICIRSDRELKKYLYPYMELLFKSDEALIGENDLKTILDAWKRYFKVSDYPDELNNKSKEYKLTLRNLKDLINYFKLNWKDEKNKFEFNNKGEKWDPLINNFLYKDDYEIIKIAANCLRKYLGTKEFQNNITNTFDKSGDSIEVDIIENLPDGRKHPLEKATKPPFAEFSNKFIYKQKKEIFNNRFLEDKKSFKKYPQRLKAWKLIAKINIEKKYMRNDIKGELAKIAAKCIGQKEGETSKVPWLQKRFQYEDVLQEVFTRYKEELINISKEITNKKTIDKYNDKNSIHKIDSYIVQKIRDQILIKNKDNKGEEQTEYIFTDPEELKKFRLNFQNFLNPKKGRKRELVLLVREILKDNNINY